LGKSQRLVPVAWQTNNSRRALSIKTPQETTLAIRVA